MFDRVARLLQRNEAFLLDDLLAFSERIQSMKSFDLPAARRRCRDRVCARSGSCRCAPTSVPGSTPARPFSSRPSASSRPCFCSPCRCSPSPSGVLRDVLDDFRRAVHLADARCGIRAASCPPSCRRCARGNSRRCPSYSARPKRTILPVIAGLICSQSLIDATLPPRSRVSSSMEISFIGFDGCE